MDITIKEVSKLEIEKYNILSWSIWSCYISSFDWELSEGSCLIIQGEVIIKTKLETITISAGDFIIFLKGLKCHWQVIQPIKKHYTFT